MEKNYDLIIVGCGPAAIQMAVRLEELRNKYKKNINYLIIERNSMAGSFFNFYPVHGRLISNNKLYSGTPRESEYSERFDWNSILMDDDEIQARDYSSDFYPLSSIIPQMLRDIVDKFNININFNETVVKIEKNKGNFLVQTEKGCYETKYVTIATGLEPKIPEIKGYELTTPYHKMRHKSYYRDKSVFIIGKGNSALECAGDIMNEANMIICASPEPIRFAYQTHYVGSPRLVNSVPIENYQLKSLSAILDCEICEIRKDEKGYRVKVAYQHAQGEIEDIYADEVICATGFQPIIPEIIPSISRLKDVWPNIDGNFMSVDMEGLSFAGAITHGLDYKQFSSSGFIHGFRYNSILLAQHLFSKIVGEEIKKEIIDFDVRDYIFDRMNNNSGIYLQPGFLGVHLVLEDKKLYDCGYSTVIAFDELDVMDEKKLHMLITLEYGDINACMNDPLNIARRPGVIEASLHIHPIIRIKSRNMHKTIALEENLFNRFNSSDVNINIMEKLVNEIIAG